MKKPGTYHQLIRELDVCVNPAHGWKAFEDLTTRIILQLFMPPLCNPQRQSRTYSGISRLDLILSNRNIDPGRTAGEKNWHILRSDLEARMIIFEIKKYNKASINKEDVNQLEAYMKDQMGRFAILVCNKQPTDSAYTQRNNIYSQRQKLILFITAQQLRQMLQLAAAGKEPSDLILDLTEEVIIRGD